jgi:beta-N-acetylhexosaminidase
VLAACGATTPSNTAASPTTAPPTSPPGTSPSTTNGPSASSTAKPTSTPSGSASPLRAKIAQLLVVGFRGLTITDTSRISKAIANDGLGGVVLFDKDGKTGKPRNIESPQQLTTLISNLKRQAHGRRLIVAIDQEGGKVDRLKTAYGFPAAASEASIGQTNDTAAATTWASSIATTLASVGINLNLAPVVDLNVNPKNPAIGALDRSFSADPNVVIRLASAEISAHHEAGVRTCLKHFPGLGSATTNTDFGVADVTKTWTGTELKPFQSLIEARLADAIMAANLVNRKLDPAHPASLSKPIVTDLLRDQLGWTGVVITDDLGAAAITTSFGQGEAIALALEAGNDLLLFANQQDYDSTLIAKVLDIIEAHVASGRITEARIDESITRVNAFTKGLS